MMTDEGRDTQSLRLNYGTAPLAISKSGQLKSRVGGDKELVKAQTEAAWWIDRRC